ncbi:MAG: hypothetical protein H6811_05115 [Phycisphaeraceae bacterium]|nr:hypothetical protein [Phycisphaeraceae bacterium]
MPHCQTRADVPDGTLVATTVWAALPASIGAVILADAAVKWGWSHCEVAGAASAGAALLAAAPLIGFVIVRRKPFIPRWITLHAGTLAFYAPAIITATLPWEEPETGFGSPAATGISVVALLMGCAVLFHAPWFFVLHSCRAKAQVPRSSPH